jgi:hypothetical protein
MNMEEFLERFQDDPGYIEQLENRRTLRVRWSMELAEDLRRMHGIDAEETLNEILAEEIATEMGLSELARPQIRRVMPTLLEENVVGVQPLGSPVGVVFSLRTDIEDFQPVKRIEMGTLPSDHFTNYEDLFKI